MNKQFITCIMYDSKHVGFFHKKRFYTKEKSRIYEKNKKTIEDCILYLIEKHDLDWKLIRIKKELKNKENYELADQLFDFLFEKQIKKLI